MSEKSIKKLRKQIKQKYDSIEYDKLPFKRVWKTIKKGIRSGVIKKGEQ